MERWITRVRAIIISFFMQMVEAERRRLVKLGKIQAAVAYVKGVRVARMGVMAVIGLVACCMVLFLGLVLIHVAFFISVPWAVETKLLVMAVLGLVYAAGALLLMGSLLSQKRWMRCSGATKMVEEATEGD